MRKRFMAALLALFCVVTALALPAAAAGPGIIDKRSSMLTLNYPDKQSQNKVNLEDTVFDLYKVGDYRYDAQESHTNPDAYSFVPTSEFEGAIQGSVQLPNLSYWTEGPGSDGNNSEKTGETANALVKYADDPAHEVTKYMDSRKIKNGETVFYPLEPGLYLVRGATKTIDKREYTPQSFLIPLPYPGKDSNGDLIFNYKVLANVKYSQGGSLTVSKTVAGKTPDPGEKFSFTVTLKNKTINGKYGDVTFTGGEANFELEHNQSVLITGLPDGTEYTVEEVSRPNGYIMSSSGATGKIDVAAATSPTAAFTNVYNAPGTGSFIVRKTVTGKTPDPAEKFSFTVTLNNRTIDGEYGDVTFTGGEAKFDLAHGGSVAITGLPKGIEYTVEEILDEADGSNYTVSPEKATGTIKEYQIAEAAFTNEYKTSADPGKGRLRIGVEVAGNAADPAKEFNFSIYNDTPAARSAAPRAAASVAGKVPVTDFYLAHNNIFGVSLPPGDYIVVESEYGDYAVKSWVEGTGQTGNEVINRVTVVANETTTVRFLNTRNRAQSDTPVDITVNKIWDPNNGTNTSVTARLLRDNREVGSAELNAANGWKHIWKNMEPGNYRVVEDEVSGYTSAVTSDGNNNFTITNIENTDTVEITVNKVWEPDDGNHPDSVTVRLMRNGAAVGNDVELNAANRWRHTWEVQQGPGDVRFSVVEPNVPDGYIAVVTRDGNIFTITNSGTPPTTTPGGDNPPGGGGDNPPGGGGGPTGGGSTPMPTPTLTPPPPVTPSPSHTPASNPPPPSETPPPGTSSPSDSTPPGVPPFYSLSEYTPPPGGNPPSDSSGLPQTGQLWWPVPLLVVAGVPLLLVGAILVFRKKKP